MANTISRLSLVLFAAISINAHAGLFGLGGTSWKEEVVLHDGQKIIVERTAKRHGRHEIGQRPPIGDQSISFTLPGTHRQVEWKDEFSEDVGGANFNLMALGMAKGVAYLVVTPAGCLSYNKWGRPNPPYVIFKNQDKEWVRITLQELPDDIKLPNMLHSSPDDFAEKRAKDGIVSAEIIRSESTRFRQPQYRIIQRAAMATNVECIMTNYYKGYGWLSPDWFSDQPSLEACVRFCDGKKLAKEVCPCNNFFKGNYNHGSHN